MMTPVKIIRNGRMAWWRWRITRYLESSGKLSAKLRRCVEENPDLSAWFEAEMSWRSALRDDFQTWIGSVPTSAGPASDSATVVSSRNATEKFSGRSVAMVGLAVAAAVSLMVGVAWYQTRGPVDRVVERGRGQTPSDVQSGPTPSPTTIISPDSIRLLASTWMAGERVVGLLSREGGRVVQTTYRRWPGVPPAGEDETTSDLEHRTQTTKVENGSGQRLRRTGLWMTQWAYQLDGMFDTIGRPVDPPAKS